MLITLLFYLLISKHFSLPHAERELPVDKKTMMEITWRIYTCQPKQKQVGQKQKILELP